MRGPSICNSVLTEKWLKCGGVAQLVERFHGMEKVLGSTPCTSTILKEGLGNESFFFAHASKSRPTLTSLRDGTPDVFHSPRLKS